MKEMFPDKNQFLLYPRMQAEKKRLREFMGIFRVDGQPLDPKFANYLETVDPIKFMEGIMPMVPHPTDKSRNKWEDLKKGFVKLSEKVRRRGKDLAFPHEINRILKDVNEEYGHTKVTVEDTEKWIEDGA